jgi:hypothetical protein
MVLITPRLVRPLNPDEVPSLPTVPGQFLPPPGGDAELLDRGGSGVADGPAVVGRAPATRPRGQQ